MKKYLRIAGISLQTAVAYPARLISGFGFYALFIYVFFRLWNAVYAAGLQSDYELRHIVWYLCVTEVIAFSTRSEQFGQMEESIKTGAIAYQLARPYHYLGYQFAYGMGQTLFNLCVYGALAACMGLISVGPLTDFNAAHLPPMLLCLMLGLLINFFFRLAISLSAFQLEDSFGPYMIYQKLIFMLGTFLPIELLPEWLRNAALKLPFSYVAWAPARLITRFSWETFRHILPLQVFWAAAAGVTTLLLFRAGEKKLSAHGG